MEQPQPSVEQLSAQLQKLREDIKESQPNILGALRTFVFDVRDWRAGKRDFPQSALLGLVFAYLRPRLVLAVGSVAAVILASAQLWLLWRQNTLFERSAPAERRREFLSAVHTLYNIYFLAIEWSKNPLSGREPGMLNLSVVQMNAALTLICETMSETRAPLTVGGEIGNAISHLNERDGSIQLGAVTGVIVERYCSRASDGWQPVENPHLSTMAREYGATSHVSPSEMSRIRKLIPDADPSESTQRKFAGLKGPKN